MSRETSVGAGKPYGLARVCRVLELPRSTVYAQAQRQAAKVVPFHPARRGPKPNVSDADLLNNTALFNGQGIFIQSSNRLAIRGNAIGENSRFGLRMSSSEGCNVTDNDIYENQFAGANLVDCTNNLLYHNVFRDNGIQNAADNGQNRWDAGADGGGNYWSDYRVSSSLADSSYQVAGGLLDRYPFQVPWEWL